MSSCVLECVVLRFVVCGVNVFCYEERAPPFCGAFFFNFGKYTLLLKKYLDNENGLVYMVSKRITLARFHSDGGVFCSWSWGVLLR